MTDKKNDINASEARMLAKEAGKKEVKLDHEFLTRVIREAAESGEYSIYIDLRVGHFMASNLSSFAYHFNRYLKKRGFTCKTKEYYISYDGKITGNVYITWA